MTVTYRIDEPEHEFEVEDEEIHGCRNPEEVKELLVSRMDHALKWASLWQHLGEGMLDEALEIWKNRPADEEETEEEDS